MWTICGCSRWMGSWAVRSLDSKRILFIIFPGHLTARGSSSGEGTPNPTSSFSATPQNNVLVAVVAGLQTVLFFFLCSHSFRMECGGLTLLFRRRPNLRLDFFFFRSAARLPPPDRS